MVALTVGCLAQAIAQTSLASSSNRTQATLPKTQDRRTDAAKKAAHEAFQAELKADQIAYDNFRYTDGQREQTVEFIAAAMKVIRGDAKIESLTQLLPIVSTRMGQELNPSTRNSFDARFLNVWTNIHLHTISRQEDRTDPEPALFQIEFGPPIDIPRDRLEKLLQLKVAHGWISEGGNLRPDLLLLHDRQPFNGGYFEYSPLKQPQADFEVFVELTYLNGPDKNPYTATRLSQVTLSRKYLSPSEIKQRNNQKLGHLPQTGERAPKDGRYVAIFADDAMTASVPQEQRMCTYGAGQWLGPAHAWNPEAGKTQPMHAWWQWAGPDPLATELEKLFPTSTPRRPS